MLLEAYQSIPEKYRAPLTVTEVLVAGNRGTCGGVNMAIQATNQVLDIVGGREPVFTNWDVVNNRPVMDRLTKKGLINVRNDLDSVPNGSIMLWSAHGVPPEYHSIAAEKNFLTVDLSCRLVTKVHDKAKEAEAEGKHVLYIGKNKHPETVGVLGELQKANRTFVEAGSNIDGLVFPDRKPIIVFTQTTLATAEVRDTQKALKDKFPDIEIPERWDICYATDSRQLAVEDLIENYGIDFLLVAGSSHSHNSQELENIAKKREIPIPSALVDSASDIQRAWFTTGVKTVGAISGASEEEEDFQDLLSIFTHEGIEPESVPQVKTENNTTFPLPKEDIDALRQRMAA